jgi:hypothetical protein
MSAARHRGQPLASLGLLLAGWVGLRATVWEPPFPLPLPDATPAAIVTNAAPQPLPGDETAKPEPVAPPILAAAPLPPIDRSVLPPGLLARPPETLPMAGGAREVIARDPAPALTPPAAEPSLAAAHQLLYLAALGRLPLPPGLGLSAIAPRLPATPVLLAAAAPRWSGDAWVLVRRGSGGLAAASGSPSYGASQAGGVLRYALAPGSARAPQAYLRVSRALGGFAEGEAAAGLSVRPFAGVPLRLLGEARVQRSAGASHVRPVASLVSELPPVRLPLGIEGEAYAQAGYAGAPFGAKGGATPFFDVQAVADRRLASAGPAEFRLGAGAWSGGQKGAARLDLGPRATIRLAAGPAASRLALDWRFRVAGNARPASGPTLTFSAGF